MKKVFSLVCLVALTLSLHAVNFRFALLTDIHISPSNPSPLEDLRRSIDDIKSLDSIDFVLISGDADFAPALRVVRYSAGHSVIVFNPQSSICNELRRYATFYKNIPMGFCEGCRLPDSIETGDGRTISCPAAWMAGRSGSS